MTMELNALKKNIFTHEYDEINEWISTNYTRLFNPVVLKEIHPLLCDCENLRLNNFSRLIKAWISFTYGDNIELNKILIIMDRQSLVEKNEISLMDSLYALCGDLISLSIVDKITYGHNALNILGDDHESLFFANANLTLGQLYSAKNSYHDAVNYFNKAHRAFSKLDCEFLAILADVNRLLNMFKLGEYNVVIDDANRALHRFASFRQSEVNNDSQMDSLSFIYHLPIGMSLVEMGKLDVSLHHLSKFKDNLDPLEFFHMHGLIEWTYLKALFLKKAYPILETELIRLRKKFGAMNSIFISVIFDYYELLISYESSMDSNPVTLEKTVLLLEKHADQMNFITVEMMIELQLRGIHIFFSKSEINQLYDSVRNFNIIPLISIVTRLLNQTEMDITHREIEILELAARGLSNDAIGKELFITTGTVKWHLNNLYSKLNVRNRVQAIEKVKSLNIKLNT